MKPTNGITLPASFVVTLSHAGTEILPTAPADNDILTVAEVAELLKCKPSSIYNMTSRRGRARYDHSIPVLGLLIGSAFPSVVCSRLAEFSGDDECGMTIRVFRCQGFPDFEPIAANFTKRATRASALPTGVL